MTATCPPPHPHILSVATDGTLRCLWTDKLPLADLGRLTIERASTIEFDHAAQCWQVHINGTIHFSHPFRDQCLAWEHDHFNELLNA